MFGFNQIHETISLILSGNGMRGLKSFLNSLFAGLGSPGPDTKIGRTGMAKRMSIIIGYHGTIGLNSGKKKLSSAIMRIILLMGIEESPI